MTPQDTVSHRKLVNKQVRRGETSKIPSKCENSIPGQILNYLAPGSTKIFYLTLFGGVLFLLWKCQTSTCARRILANRETSCHPRFRACSKALRIGPEKRWFFNIVLVNAHNIQKKKHFWLKNWGVGSEWFYIVALLFCVHLHKTCKIHCAIKYQLIYRL